ncbi:unnamed protein product, partial [Vitis vinifera]
MDSKKTFSSERPPTTPYPPQARDLRTEALINDQTIYRLRKTTVIKKKNKTWAFNMYTETQEFWLLYLYSS